MADRRVSAARTRAVSGAVTLLLIVAAVWWAGCARTLEPATLTTFVGETSSTPAGGKGPQAGTGTTTLTPGSLQPPVTAPPGNISPEARAYARSFKQTMAAVARLGGEVESANVPDNDPSVGRLYALRARGQTILAGKSLMEHQNTLADAATQQARTLLLRASRIADGSVAQAVAKAQADLQQLTGLPSEAPDKAEPVLSKVSADLAAAMPPAQSPSTSAPATPPTG
jgi:hypothetical protein